MYKRGDREFVLDMFLSCQKIFQYTKDLSFEDFKKDSKTIDAVVRNIEILGEAVKNISKEFRNKYPYIGWSMIAKARDKMIHFYFGIDTYILWKIIKKDIFELFEKLKNIIEKEGWKDQIEY
ncbi:DUF86 domain-containing protein [Thermosipho ferrireducens]|uniref:DUF86 domain-containing protein n=1 Tax=Thermosipho ferrireducens TaxID=2571116 RepID=A0ABX7S6L7_9BACT|nr:DUF86 domain-containing protein [Thermosipho ferrireducens]QTA38233.1 DUF86 domain-containing protein [Thermosipho ferrireducens]